MPSDLSVKKETKDMATWIERWTNEKGTNECVKTDDPDDPVDHISYHHNENTDGVTYVNVTYKDGHSEGYREE